MFDNHLNEGFQFSFIGFHILSCLRRVIYSYNFSSRDYINRFMHFKFFDGFIKFKMEMPFKKHFDFKINDFGWLFCKTMFSIFLWHLEWKVLYSSSPNLYPELIYKVLKGTCWGRILREYLPILLKNLEFDLF